MPVSAGRYGDAAADEEPTSYTTGKVLATNELLGGAPGVIVGGATHLVHMVDVMVS